MSDTTFSIALQGLNLPAEVKARIEAELRSLVLSEIAKTDLGNQINVEPLPVSSDRSLPSLPSILGFVVRHPTVPTLPEITAARGMVSLTGTGNVTAVGTGAGLGLPLDGVSLGDVLEAVYYRPDIQAAIISNSQAFAELLSHDEQATQVFNQLTGGTEKLAPLLVGAILLACAAAGVGVGIASRK